MPSAKNNLVPNNVESKNKGIPALKSALATQAIKKQIKSLLGDRSGHFMMAIVQVVEGTPQLQECDPQSIINASIASAVLNLPIEKNLGFCYIVPYKDKEKGNLAQFQLGYKGYIQLALRSGEYKFINAVEVKEEELKGYNFLTGELELDFIKDIDQRIEAKTIGYASYIEFNNGFRNTLFMTVSQIENHARKYSQAYQYDLRKGYSISNWSKNFEAMALKTVLKLNLSKFGALSVEVQKALQTDGLTIDKIEEDGTIIGNFSDNTGDENIVLGDNIEEKPSNEDLKTLIAIANANSLDISKIAKEKFGITVLDRMSMKQYKELKEIAINGEV